jgi:hypothetical protein
MRGLPPVAQEAALAATPPALERLSEGLQAACLGGR